MKIIEVTATPEHYQLGKSKCTVTYKAKTIVGGKGTQKLTLNGGDGINFVQGSVQTKTIGPIEVQFDAQEKIYTVETTIEVKSKSRGEQAFNIELETIDNHGIKSSKRVSLSYD